MGEEIGKSAIREERCENKKMVQSKGIKRQERELRATQPITRWGVERKERKRKG